jgi:hypothetical protein
MKPHFTSINEFLGQAESEAPMKQHYWSQDKLVAPEFGHVHACQRRTEPLAWAPQGEAGTRHLTANDPAWLSLVAVSASLV